MPTPDKDFDTLVKDLHNDDEWVALDAAKALNELNDPRMIPHLLTELDYNTRMSRFDEVMEERRKAGQRTYMFWEWHGVYLSDLRCEAARGIFALLGQEAIPILTKILDEDTDFDLCVSVAYLLSNMPSDETVETLDRCLKRAYDSNEGTNLVYLLRALNRIDTLGAKEAVERWQKVVGKVL